MNSKKQCSVMLDLLPLYQEGLLRPETEQTGSAHLQECADCRRAYEELRNDKLPGVPEADRHAENLKQAAPLRKFRFHLWMNILGAPLWLPLLLTAVLEDVCGGGQARGGLPPLLLPQFGYAPHPVRPLPARSSLS